TPSQSNNTASNFTGSLSLISIQELKAYAALGLEADFAYNFGCSAAGNVEPGKSPPLLHGSNAAAGGR
ncbi:MAG: hypothetical protein O9353_12090, partial [Bacteroidia bacterium]|nr:hypothetical protein [Bacteroidia bacterium]